MRKRPSVSSQRAAPSSPLPSLLQVRQRRQQLLRVKQARAARPLQRRALQRLRVVLTEKPRSENGRRLQRRLTQLAQLQTLPLLVRRAQDSPKRLSAFVRMQQPLPLPPTSPPPASPLLRPRSRRLRLLHARHQRPRRRARANAMRLASRPLLLLPLLLPILSPRALRETPVWRRHRLLLPLLPRDRLQQPPLLPPLRRRLQ